MTAIDSSDDTGPVELIPQESVDSALRSQIRPTTFIASERLSETLGARVLIASETFQHTGSFKFRAATAAASFYERDHLITASSGNFGAALALACRRAGKRCTVIMPIGSSATKVAAVERLGAAIDRLDTSEKTRQQRLTELAAEHPTAQAVSAYDDPWVIAGNATLGAEILAADSPEVIVVPIGGGGLSSGIVRARQRHGGKSLVWGAEPALGNDAARSLRAGVLSHNDAEPATICDGARTLSLGQRNFAILRRGLGGVTEVSEENVRRAVRLLYHEANLKAEPTGALAIAALLQDPARFAGKRVTCVVSGGNVDPALYAELIAA